MEFLNSVIAFFQGDVVMTIVITLLAISEALGSIPSIKANGVFTAIVNGLKWLKDKVLK